MDFIMGLPKTSRGYDVIWVIVDRLRKSVLLMAIRRTTPIEKLEKLYVDEVIKLRGVPLSVVFDRDPRFTYNCGLH